VHYPLSGWKVFNLAITAHNDPTELVAGKAVTHEEVMAGFRGIHPQAQAIIQHGRDWKAWVICDRDPVEHWVDGRISLLGDAAHPMLQYFAQGACMALEDAVCLAHEMHASPDRPEVALETYQNKRVLRTARVQLGSRALGEHVYHPRSVHAALRNQLLRAKTNEDFYESLAWLYGGTGFGSHQTLPAAA
jgi:salicylate hydroxylase